MQQGFRKIGIMGGTFNPIHLGHLLVAETVRESFCLDKVIFISSGLPPHKPDNEVIAAEQRYDMVCRAIASNAYFEASRLEVDREGYTYTINTLQALKEEYGAKTELFFIIGADIIPELITWREFEHVFKLCRFVAVLRPGYNKQAFEKAVEGIKLKYDIEIDMTDAPLIDISSSDIREKCRNGKSIKYLVTEGVEEYIDERGLYKKCAMTIDEIKDKLKQMLSQKKFEHSVNVMETARLLAEKYGADAEKAALAGLIHDCARDLSSTEILALCSKYGIIADNVMQDRPELLHGTVGVFLAQELFGIDCPQIMAAIDDHTMGRAGMDKLCSIVFIADYIEPGRNFPGVDAIRQAADESLEKAMVEALDNTIEYIQKKGGFLHPQTIATRNWALKQLKRKQTFYEERTT